MGRGCAQKQISNGSTASLATVALQSVHWSKTPMPSAVIIDYGCHSFTYRLASRLRSNGPSIRYFANGSLESPNLRSLTEWEQAQPELVRNIQCTHPYGKVRLGERLKGEIEWAGHCTRALDQERPSVIVGCCIPLAALTRVQSWAVRRKIPFIYWLQDIQGRAMHDLLGRQLGFTGRALGSFAYVWEQHMIAKSRMVITIARGHERELPASVRREQRFALLENWADIEDIPVCPPANEWAGRHKLDKTVNIVYSGTLGLKHDLNTFLKLAAAFRHRPAVRIVVVSSGQAAEQFRAKSSANALTNLIILPFQDYTDVAKVLGSASVLIAPLDGSAGAFCVPSKVLAYLCAGRPTVLAIGSDNPAAVTIEHAEAGFVVEPGDADAFVIAVTRLLDDSSLRTTMGQSARRYAERTFGLDVVVPRFLDILSRSGVSFDAVKPAAPLLYAGAAS
jgi:colanic acid biosynthesis glycosyl transferase WcaI